MFNHISRDLALKLHTIADELLPPMLRDCRWFMSLPLRIIFGQHYRIYLDFKERAPYMSEQEFRDTYVVSSETAISRPTDLNRASVALIESHVQGTNIIDVGCGRGYLAGLLSDRYKVTGVDIVIPEDVRKRYAAVQFQEANVESLPFADGEFDTVICSHTLEHVRNLPLAIRELRRIGRKLIIVVPRQRPYLYTFDLHLNFFPYLFSLPQVMGKTDRKILCVDAGGDTFYCEYPGDEYKKD
jgi:SAM-dependent methyltransferase